MRPRHALITGLAALAVLAAFALPQEEEERWEYRITLDVDDDDLADLEGENWEYVGYLGQSTRGASVDEVLWRRPRE